MTRKYFPLPFLFALTLIACTGTPTPITIPVQQPVQLPKPTAVPISTAAPTSLPIPSATSPVAPTQAPTQPPTALPPTATSVSYPSLHTAGPYLVYLQPEGLNQKLVFLDADGSGRKEIVLPSDIDVQSLDALSPDGQRLVYYTGSVGSDEVGTDEAEPQGPFDLTLNILNLSSGQVEKTIPLLSSDFPANFVQAQAALANGPHSEDADQAQLYFAFLSGIRSLAWSPNSRYLAFAGQMQGLSSDLYVFDVKDQSLNRLSSGPEEIERIGPWSVDNQAVAYGSAFYVGEGSSDTSYTATRNGASSSAGFQTSPNNLSDSENAFADVQPMVGLRNLKIYNNQTQQIDVVWADCLFDFVTDRQSQTILITPMVDDDEQAPGLVLYNRKDNTFKPLANYGENWHIESWPTASFRYLAAATDGQLLAIAPNGATQTLTADAWRHELSPNNQWLAVYDKSGAPLRLFTSDGHLAAELQGLSTGRIVWRPDSQGLFLQTDDQLLYVSTTTLKPSLIAQGSGDYLDHTWVTPPQQ